MPATGDGGCIFAGMARSYGNVFPCRKIGVEPGRTRRSAPTTFAPISSGCDCLHAAKQFADLNRCDSGINIRHGVGKDQLVIMN